MAPHEELDSEIPLIYLPYWRFKGVIYTCTPEGVSHRFTDISWLAVASPPKPVPFSLGFRSQALTLTRVSVRTRGDFVRPRGFRQSFPRDKTGKHTREDSCFQEEIGEAVSLIFAPFFWQGGQIFDAVLNRSLGNDGQRDDEWGENGQAEGHGDGPAPKELCRPEKETRILPGICPDCGWDLEGQSDSLVLVCRNCHTLWQPRDHSLGKIRFGSARPDHPDQVLIPFWRIEAGARGLALSSVGTLRSLANLPVIPSQTPTESPPAFWAPAFKIRPKIFLRISRQLTLAQPQPNLEKKIRPQTHLPITLPAGEAVQSIRVTLASLARPLKEHFTGIAGARISARAATLVYLPFEPQAHEYVNAGANLAINKNVLTLSGNL